MRSSINLSLQLCESRKRRLMQMKAESEQTFSVPHIQDIFAKINQAKEDAIDIFNGCGMMLNTYDDNSIVNNLVTTTADCEAF